MANPENSRLLVVDDEPSISDPLAEYLEANGYTVATAANVDEARRVLASFEPDLVLLDVMMPGEDGLSLTRSIRAESTLPVILLTAKSEETDKIIGLEMGADDYVVKPFNPRELLARVKAVLRRAVTAPTEESGDVFEFSGFSLNISARTLSSPDGDDVTLTGGEFGLIHVLAERAGRVLSRDQLLDLTQGREAGVFDRSIDNQISRLRKKIEADPKAPTIIKTVRGGGYLLAGKVSRR